MCKDTQTYENIKICNTDYLFCVTDYLFCVTDSLICVADLIISVSSTLYVWQNNQAFLALYIGNKQCFFVIMQKDIKIFASYYKNPLYLHIDIIYDLLHVKLRIVVNGVIVKKMINVNNLKL